MTDTPDDKKTDSTEDESAGPLAGERLAAARKERKITTLEVAKELHLEEPKVRAIEQNEFDVLGAPVYAKGFLRKYARLVGVSTEDVIADYYALNRSEPMPPVVGEIRKPRREIAVVPWFTVAVILIAIAFTYWFFAIRPASVPTIEPADTETDTTVNEETGPEGGQTAAPPASSPVEAIQEAVPGGVEPDAEALPAATPATGDQEEAEVAPAQPAAPVAEETDAADLVTLTVRFTGDCWTEITDASGERLFFELGREGRVVNVTGEAPLSVLFGNADNVSLEVDGVDYPISAAARRGQTARLTIVAP